MSVTKPRTVSAFWNIVRECLVAFYSLEETEADEAVSSARHRLLAGKAKINSSYDLFYHAEPIDIASEIVDRMIPKYDCAFLERYGRIKACYTGSNSSEMKAEDWDIQQKPAERQLANIPARILVNQ